MRKKLLCLILTCCFTAGISVQAMDTAERLELLRPELDSIETMLEACEAMGLDMGYERVDYGVIRDFIEYGIQDIQWGHTQRADYVADSLEALTRQVMQKLERYQDGSEVPFPVERNLPETYGGSDGGDFIKKDGTLIISNGFGVFDKLKADIPKMQEFGADLIQIEIGPNAVLVPHDTINSWKSNLYGQAQAAVQMIDGGRGDSGHCLRIVNETQSGENGYLALNQIISVNPNTTYELSFYAKTAGAGAFSYSMQGWKAQRNYILKGTQPWTRYSASYTTGDDEYSMELLFISSGASDEIFLDDICILEDGENIVQNGDFEDSDGIRSQRFQANHGAIRDRVVRVLNRAEKNDVMVNVLISPHYFPEWILKKYPETAEIDCGLGYDINHPIIREAMELYIGTLMEEIKDHSALHSICITNEPKCDTRSQTGIQPEYAAYLQTVHGDIQKLNEIYQTSYQSFSEIQMPETDTMDAAYYDWVCFNRGYTAGWHRYLAQTVKRYAPDTAVHAKMMTIFGNSDSLNYGIEPEDFAKFTDYSGHDAWGFYGSDASGLVSKLAWYDLLESIKPGAPLINSEDHIIQDRNTNYTPKQAVHVASDIWQGAVHGRDASIVWIWGRTADTAANTYGNILYRPDVLSAAGKKSLDLNRLSQKVALLQKAPSAVSILYSPTSRAYSSRTIKGLLWAYEAALYAGANPQFITEEQLADGKIPEGLLILPGTVNISDKAYETIAVYKNGGGTVLAMGEGCLSRDEYNRSRIQTIDFDLTMPLTVHSNKVTEPDKVQLQLQIGELAQGAEPVADPNGQIVTGVEGIKVQTENGYLWNLCNYTWEGTKEIAIEGTAVDLITKQRYEGCVELKPFVPVLLEFCMRGEARIVGRAYHQWDENLYHTIHLELQNQGDLPDFLNGFIRIRNRASGEFITGMQFSKYLDSGRKSDIAYQMCLPEGVYTAVIEGDYAAGEKQLERIEIPFARE